MPRFLIVFENLYEWETTARSQKDAENKAFSFTSANVTAVFKKLPEHEEDSNRQTETKAA